MFECFGAVVCCVGSLCFGRESVEEGRREFLVGRGRRGRKAEGRNLNRRWWVERRRTSEEGLG